MPTTLDLSANPKQTKFFNDVMRECVNHDKGIAPDGDAIRYWFYGGAIRGGKTYITLGILVFLCKMYRGSRWHVVRKSMTDLKQTAIPSLEKIVKGARCKWRRSDADYFCEFEGGSRIYFMAENFNQDKDHDRWKGVETNGIVLEQLEELQKSMYDMALQRIGSWYAVDKMPPAFLFSTFNPTYNWVKKEIHDPFIKNGARPPFYYQTALPTDNAFVTLDQWRAWRQLDSKDYERMIEGSWEVNIEGTFVTAFNNSMIGQLLIDKRHPIWLSFDFNVDPMTCTVWQTDEVTYARCLQEYRTPNSDIYELCKEIREDWDLNRMEVYVTGDASGNSRNPAIRHQLNFYDIIRDELGIGRNAIKVPTQNPTIAQSRMFINAVIKNLPEFKIDKSCTYLIDDVRFVQSYLNGEGHVAIKKTGINKYANIDNRQLGHLLDTMRYFLHTALPYYVKIHKS